MTPSRPEAPRPPRGRPGAASGRDGVRASSRPAARPSAHLSPRVARGATAAAPPEQPRSIGRTVLVVAIVAFLALTLAPTVRGVLDQRAELAAAHADIAARRAEVQALTAEREAWDDPAYVERQARERLKYVFPGERGYHVIDDTGRSWDVATQPQAPSTDVELAPWYESIGASVRAVAGGNGG